MNRSQREAAKAAQEALRKERATKEAQRLRTLAEKEVHVQAALAQSVHTGKGRVDRFVAYMEGMRVGFPVRKDYDRITFHLVPIERVTPEFLAVARVLEKKAPRLFEPEIMRALSWLCTVPFVRPPETWEPRGKGCETVFRSLASHLLAKYPVPAFLWNAFTEDSIDNTKVFVQMAGHVAAGGSLIDFVKKGFPVPLTRAMCHAFLTMPAEYRFLDAIRRVQVKAAGADNRFFQAWRTTRYASMLNSKEEETFWYTVVEWFGKMALLNPSEVGPLCDYFAMRRRQDPAFSMKGRGGIATIRAMQEWHGNLSKENKIKSNAIYRMSGFKEATFKDYKRVESSGEIVHEIWRVEEILTAKKLHDEGRRMGHCVFSYGWRVERGDTSIWTIMMEDGKGQTGNWSMVTIEVRNDLRRVVQARGRFNRAMTTREHQVATRWANLNTLEISLGCW